MNLYYKNSPPTKVDIPDHIFNGPQHWNMEMIRERQMKNQIKAKYLQMLGRVQTVQTVYSPFEIPYRGYNTKGTASFGNIWDNTDTVQRGLGRSVPVGIQETDEVKTQVQQAPGAYKN